MARLPVVLFLFVVLCDLVELRDVVAGLSAIGAGATAETSIPEVDEMGTASLGTAGAISATTGATSTTLCDSEAMEVSTTGALKAVTCGIGAAFTGAAFPNDPIAEP
ncbi:MAG: hypothetical protein OK449_10630 [Thaumarchaeota archaeon]|nr:hypothetical protein [Nitrososphaerota archaeon]